jgi:acid stress chaperone HdeB
MVKQVNPELLMQSIRATLLTATLLTPTMLAAPLVVPPAMAADSLDLSAIKCQEFLGSGKDNIAMIITWLDGYYKNQDDPPILDFTKFAADSEKLAKYCAENPSIGLITAADKTLGKQ